MANRMKQNVSVNDIDASAANVYFETEKDFDYFPGTPEILSTKDAAFLLSVSEPTILRMIEDKQISLTKTSIMTYINQNFKYLKPLDLPQNIPNRP